MNEGPASGGQNDRPGAEANRRHDDGARLHSPPAERNREPIRAVLADWLPANGTVLEIASGTGQHAAHFAAAFPHLIWQPSDPDPAHRDSIRAWTQDLPKGQVLEPCDLDVTAEPWPVTQADAVYCANMIHIAPWEATLGLLRGAGALLPSGAPLILYGPFMIDGAHTAESNAGFDASLRSRDPRWGVRDLGEVAEVAATHGLRLIERRSLPANNFCVLLRRD